MKKILLIGASEFGRDLAQIFRERGCTVDLIDQESTIAHETPRVADHFYSMNALNIRMTPELPVAGYDSCIICFRAESWLLLHIIESLRRAGARDICVRVDHRQKRDLDKLLAAGAVHLIDVEQLAGERVAAAMLLK